MYPSIVVRNNFRALIAYYELSNQFQYVHKCVERGSISELGYNNYSCILVTLRKRFVGKFYNLKSVQKVT